MTHCKNRMPGLLASVVLAATLATGISSAYADGPQGGHKGMQQQAMMAGKGGQAASQGMMKGHGKKHGKGHADKQHLFGANWKSNLTDEQKFELDKLHLAFARTKAPLKAGIKALKVRFAVLATSDQVQPEMIEAKINELIMAKREMMRAKFNYISAQRRVLTPQQRVSFDMDVVHKAMHGKAGKKGRHGGKKH